MVSGRTRDGGIHVAERESTKKAREAGRDVELMRGLKAQDAGYLSVVLARERAVLARLEVAAGTEIGGDGGLVGGERPGEVLGKRKRGGKVVEETRKIVFVEGVEEQETVKKAGGALPLHQSTSSPRSVVKDQRDMTGGPDAAVDRPQRRKTKRQTTKEIERQKIEGKRQELVQRTRLKRQKAIERTKERIKQVSKAEDKLADQRARMGKSVVIGGITKDGRRFKIRQRRR